MGNAIIRTIGIILLLLCFLPMPYAYYVIVRYVICLGLLIAFVDEKKYDNIPFGRVFSYIIIFSVFNPIFRIEMDKIVWNVVDVVVAVVLAIWAIKDYKTEH
jgi:hypothetical protein